MSILQKALSRERFRRYFQAFRQAIWRSENGYALLAAGLTLLVLSSAPLSLMSMGLLACTAAVLTYVGTQIIRDTLHLLRTSVDLTSKLKESKAPETFKECVNATNENISQTTTHVQEVSNKTQDMIDKITQDTLPKIEKVAQTAIATFNENMRQTTNSVEVVATKAAEAADAIRRLSEQTSDILTSVSRPFTVITASFAALKYKISGYFLSFKPEKPSSSSELPFAPSETPSPSHSQGPTNPPWREAQKKSDAANTVFTIGWIFFTTIKDGFFNFFTFRKPLPITLEALPDGDSKESIRETPPDPSFSSSVSEPISNPSTVFLTPPPSPPSSIPYESEAGSPTPRPRF